MNRIFKVIWNRSRGQYVVADENCNSHGKGRTVLALAVSAMLSLPGITDARITGHPGTNVSKVGNVYTVTSDRVSGNVGFNRFSEFNLPAKEIANLRHPGSASHLVNFVKSQITIDGTVNSVLANNKIGGNLYFVTPTGFTVGSTGVINAGSVTAAVVKSGDFDKWDSHVGKGDYSDFTDHGGALLTAFRNGEVPVNPNGVITVNGSINAGNGITLTASKINIGNGARLKTGVSDFSNLVNIKDGQGNVSVDSGVDGIALAGTADGTGDIILSARSDAAGQAFSTKAEATVTISGDAVIEAKSFDGADKKANAMIASNALAGKQSMEYSDKEGKYILTASRDKYDVLNTVTASTTVGSGATISADGITSVSATADNKMGSSFIQELAGDILNFVWEQTPLSEVATAAAWAKLKTSADVTIEDGATLSGGKAVNVSANARTELSAEGAAAFDRLFDAKLSEKVPSIGVAIGIADSDAHVTVNGTLKSSGDLIIDAKNELTSTVSAEIANGGTTASPTVFALSVLNGSAKADIGQTAKLDMTDGNGAGNLIIGAEQKSETETSAVARSNEGAKFSFAFSWADISTDATVNLNTGLTGTAKNVSVFSDNTATGLKVTGVTGGTTAPGLEDLLAIVEGKVATGVLAAIMKKSMADLKPDTPDFDDSFKGGVAATVLRYGQHATTNIKENAGITAVGELEATSAAALEDHYFQAEGGYKVKAQQQENGGALALLVTTGKGGGVTAQTDIGDGTVLSAGSEMTISSETKIPYGRVQKMKEELYASFDQLKTLFTSEEAAAIEEKKNLALEKLEEYEKKTAGDPSISPVAGADENVSDVLNAVGDYYETVNGFLGKARESYKGLVAVWMTSRSFANFTNYTNTYVGAGGKTDAQGHGSWSAEGAFAWNELSSKAATTIGRGAKLTSGSDMNISADGQMTNTLLAGYFPNYTSALGFNVLRDFFREGDASPIGATLGLQFLDGQASVTVKEGAVLESSEGDVSLSSKTDTVSVGIAGSASKTNGKVAVTVMSNVIMADVVSEVSVDDEASLISKKKDVSLSAENDASLQSVSASMAWQSGQEAAGAGMAGVAVVLGDMTADVTVADNDGEQNLYNTDGSLSATEGTVRAKADADTKSNAIGAAMAGTAAKSEGAKELKPDWMRWLENHNLPEKVDDLLGKGIGKIVDSINEARGVAGAAAGANNPGNNPANPIGNGNNAQMGQAVPLNDADFQLDAAGSAAWNVVDVYSTVNLGAVKKDKDGKQLASKTINISAANAELDALSDHWIGAWAGSGAVSLMGDRQNVNSGYSVAGTLAMNKGELVTKVKAKGADVELGDEGLFKAMSSSDGTLVSEGIALAITTISGTGHSFDGDLSLNFMDNKSGTELDTVSASGKKLSWEQTAWAGDRQVTGGTAIGFAKGQAAYAGGGTIAIAKLNNTVMSELKNATFSDASLSAFSVEALSSMKQITTAVSGQVAVATDAQASSLAIGGAVAGVTVTNTVTANVENVTADLTENGTFDIVSESITRQEATDKGIKTGKRQSFYSEEEAEADRQKKEALNDKAEQSADNSSFIGNVEVKKDTSTETAKDYSVKPGENQKIADLRQAGKLEQLTVAVNAASGKNTGGGAVISQSADNTFKATGKGLELNKDKDAAGSSLRLKAESQVSTIGVAVGATVSQPSAAGRKMDIGGSVIVSNVNQTSEAGVTDSAARVSNVSAEAKNDASTVNVAGNVGLTLGSGKSITGSASVIVANTENTANAYVAGTPGNTAKAFGAKDAANAGKLTVSAANSAQTWAAAVEGSFAAQSAGGGSVTVNRVFQHTDAQLSDASLNRFTDVAVSAGDDSKLWTLAGGVAVTWNEGSALNGAVAYTQAGRENDEQEQEKTYKKTGTRAGVSNVKLAGGVSGDMTVTADTVDALHTLAVSAGVSAGIFGFSGSANVNTVYHATGVDVSGLTRADGEGIGKIAGAFEADATNTSSISGLSITGAGSFGGAGVGLSTAVNRMGTDTYANISNAKVVSGTSHVSARSDLSTDMIGIFGQGSASYGGDGFVAVNLINDKTALNVSSSTLTTDGGNVLEAIGTSTIGSYAGGLSVAGTGGGNISVSVSERKGDVTVDVDDSTLYSSGTGSAVKHTTGIKDDDIVHDSFKQDIDLKDSLAGKFQTADTKGVAVDAYSASTFKTFTVLAAGSGTFAGNGLGVGNVDSGKTAVNVTKSTVYSGDANTDIKAGSYTNFYTVLVEGEGAGTFSLGLNGEWISSSRTASATVTSSEIDAYDASLEAENKTGSSGVTIFGGGSASVAGGAAAVITRHTGSAATSLASSVVNTDHDYLQDAYRLSNFRFMTLGGHGAANVAVTGDGFISYDDGDAMSSVAMSGVSAGNDITVKSDRSTDVKTALAQAQGAMYAAIGGIVSVNTINTRSSTSVADTVKEGQLNDKWALSAGHDVNVAATGKTKTELIEVDVTGSGQIGSGALGIGVTETSDNSTSSVAVAGAKMKAGNDANIAASQDRFHNQKTVFVTGSGGIVTGGINISVMGVDINTAYDASKDPNAGTGLPGYRNMLSTVGAAVVSDPSIAGTGTVPGTALTDTEKDSVLAATSLDAGKRVLGKTSVGIADATVEAKNISVKTAEDTAEDAGAKLLAADATAAFSIGLALDVNLAKLDQQRNMDTTVDHSVLKATESLTLSNDAAGVYDLKQWSVGASVVAVAVEKAENNISGTSSVNVVNGSKLTAGSLSVNNSDRSSHSADARSVTVGALAVSPVFAFVTDKSLQRVTLSSSEINVTDAQIFADRNHQLSTYIQPIVTIGVGVDVSKAVSEDDAGSSDWITLSGNTVNAATLLVNANDRADLKAEALHVSGNAGEVMSALAKSVANGTVGISATGNTLASGVSVLTASAGLYDANDKDATETLRLSAQQKAYGTGLVFMAGTQTSMAESNVTVKNTFRNNTLKDIDGGEGQKLGVIAASDVRFTATGKSGTGSVLPLISYASEADNNTKTVLDFGGLDSGEVTKVGDVYAGVSNMAEYTVDTNTFDIGVISGMSPSKTRVKDYAGAEANVTGNWLSDDDVTFFSSIETIGSLYAKANGGAVAGYSGALVDADIKGTSVLNVKDATITADRLGLSAVTDTTLKSAKDDGPALESSYYGVIIAGGGTLTNTVNRTAQINVTDSVLTADRTVKIGAKDLADIKLNSSTATGSLVSIANATVKDNLTFTNKIALNGNTVVKTTEDDSKITIAAWSEENVEAKSLATGEGLLARATADTVMNLTRTNDVTIGGSSLVYSAGDVEINAGRGLAGDVASAYKVSAEAITKGIPLGSPTTLSGTANLIDHVTVEGGANVRSVADTEVYAGDGSFSLKQQSKYTYEDNDEERQDKTPVTVQKDSKDRVGTASDSVINVDGSVIAGVQNKSKITFSGLVDKDGGKNYMITDSHGNVLDVIAEPVVTVEGAGPDILRTDSESVANNYWKRHEELHNLITEYQAKGTAESRAMVLAYMQEDAFLLKEMESRGLAEKQPDGSYVIVDKVRRGVIDLSGITVSGGDISLYAAHVTGGAAGEIRAQGGEGINILNESNMALSVSDLTILKDGGHLTVNGDDYRTTAARLVMHDFAGTASGPGGSAATNSININAAYTGDRNVVVTGGGQSYRTIVDNAVMVSGELENRAHDINITTRDSVTIDEKAKLLAAGAIHVSAQGSIVQRYSPGLTNVGGNANAPETIYANSIRTFLETAAKFETPDNWTLATDAKDPSYKVDYSAGIVAGGDIYFAGQMINVNGIIQSGFADYSVDVTDAASEKRIAQIKTAWEDAGSPTLTTVKTDTYLVKKGGQYLTENNVFAYRPDVWYDPAKEQLIVDDVKATGGSIYLTGAISSTGAGRIYSADGALGLKVTAGSHDLALGEVDTGANRVGLVRITDTNFMTDTWDAKVTDYTGGKTTSYMTKVEGDKTIEGDKTVTEGYAAYTPKAGLIYGWTSGETTGEVVTKTADQDFTVWSLFDWGSEKVKWNTTTEKKERADLVKGATVGDVARTTDSEFVAWVNKWDVTKTTTRNVTKTYDNWTHFSGTYHAKEVTTEASTNLYSMTAKADKPITVGMLKGSGNVDVTSSGSILLRENVTAKDGSVTMTAGKSILSDGDDISIKDAKAVTLTAKTGSVGAGQRAVRITGEQGTSTVAAWTETAASAADVKEMSADAKQEYDALSASKVLSLNVSAATGAYIDASGWHNRIDAGEIAAGEDAVLLGTGDVKVGSIHGKNITVSSEKGGVYIGNVDQTQNTGLTQQLNGTARYRYTVADASDNIYLGQIKATSAHSEISLTAKGELINALPREAAEEFSAEEKIKTWKEAGLIGQSGENIGEQIWTEREAMVRNSVTSEFSYYRQLDAEPDKSKWSQEKKDTFAQLESRYKGMTTPEEALANNTEYQNLVKSKGDFGWTQTELLFAVADTIINPGSSSSESLFLTTPNVTAEKVTLKANKGSVGTKEDPVTAKFEDFGDEEKSEVLYKALAKADIGDITWDKNNRLVTVAVHRPVTLASSSPDSPTHVTASAVAAPGDDVTIAYLSDNKLVVESVAANDQVRISAKKGMEGLDGPDKVTGDRVTLRAGEGDLTDIVVNAKKWVALSAGGDISAEATEGPLVLYSVAGGGDVVLKAGEIDSYTDPLDPEGVESGGIIKAEGDVVLDATNIGRKDGGLGAVRLADNTTLVIAKDEIESLYVSSKGTLKVGSKDAPEGELVIRKNEELSGTGVMSLKAKNIETTSAIKTETAATLKTDDGYVTVGGKLSSDEDITVNAATVINVNADIAAKGDTDLKAPDIVFADKTPAVNVSGDTVTVTTTEKALNTGTADFSAGTLLALYSKDIGTGTGTLSSGKDIVIGNTDESLAGVPVTDTVTLSGTTVNAGGTATFSAKKLSAEGADMSAADAVLKAEGDMSLDKTYADVTGTVGITAKKLTTDGTELLSGGDMTVTVTDDAQLTDTTLRSGGSMAVAAGKDIVSDAAFVAFKDISVSGRELTLTGDITVATGQITVAGDKVTFSHDENILQSVLAETGITVTAKGDADLGNAMFRTGSKAASSDVTVSGKGVTADKAIVRASRDIVMTATGETGTDGDLFFNGSSLKAEKTVSLTGRSLMTDKADIRGNEIDMDVTDGILFVESDVRAKTDLEIITKNFATTGSAVVSDAKINVDAAESVLLDGGTFSAGGDMTVKAGDDIVSDAGLSAGGDILVEVGKTLTLEGNTVSKTGDVTLKASDIDLEQTDEMTIAGKSVTIESDTQLDLGSAVLEASGGNVHAHADGVTAKKGIITADNGSVEIIARDAPETGGRLGDVVLDGTIVSAKNDVTVTAKSLEANGASVTSDDINFDVTKSVILDGSVVDAVQDLEIKADNLSAFGSNVESDGKINVDAAEAVILDGGTFSAGGDMTVTAGNDVTSDAGLTAGGNIDVTAGKMLTLEGDTVSTTGSVTLKATDIDLEQTDDMKISGKSVTIESDTQLDLGSADLTATDGNVYAHADGVTAKKGMITADNGSVEIIARDAPETGGRLGDVILDGTSVTAKDDVTITAKSLEATESTLSSDEINLDVTDYVYFEGSTVKAVKDLDITADKFATLGSSVTSAGDITADVADSMLLDDGIFSAGGEITLNAGNDIYSDAGLTAGSHVTATAGGLLALEGDTLSENGDVTLSAADIDLEQTDKMTISGNRVTIASASNLDIGTARVIAKEGDVDIDSQDGMTAGAGRIESALGNVYIDANDNEQGTGDIAFNGLKVLAAKNALINGDTLSMHNTGIDAAGIVLASEGQMTLSGGTALHADDAKLTSETGSVVQTGVSAGAGISAEKLSVSAEHGSVSLGALPAHGLGGNRISDMTVKVRDELNIGAAADKLRLDITQTEGDLKDVTVHNAGGSVELKNDLSSEKDALVYASGITAGNISAGNLVELSSIGLDGTGNQGINAGDLSGARVAVATTSGDIKTGNIDSASRIDIYRNALHVPGSVSLANVSAPTVKILNGLGTIEAGRISFTDRQESALIRNMAYPTAAGFGSGLRDIPVGLFTGRNALQSYMAGLAVLDAAWIKGAHVDLLKLQGMSSPVDKFLPQISLYRSYDLNSPAGYYFGLNIREDISFDSVDGLPVIHEHLLTEDGIDLTTDALTLSLSDVGDIELGYGQK